MASEGKPFHPVDPSDKTHANSQAFQDADQNSSGQTYDYGVGAFLAQRDARPGHEGQGNIPSEKPNINFSVFVSVLIPFHISNWKTCLLRPLRPCHLQRTVR
jgi:hypothetical protein